MRSYGQYCPVAKGAELLGDRWTLLILREFLFGTLRFTELERGLPGISRSVLSGRLSRLQRDGIIDRTEDGYRFTEAGEGVRPVLEALGEWVGYWILQDPEPAECDPELLMTFISRRVDRDALPDGKTVIEFDFTDVGNRYWLTMEANDVSVCKEDPCLPIAVWVKGTVADVHRVYVGRVTLDNAVAAGEVRLEGRPAMQRAFRRWMIWSKFAPAVQAGLARRG
jgi:DNA-binding HxlR family transcriptional regulator